MSKQTAGAEAWDDLLTVFDHSLPRVYGYLLARCGQVALAEDLTSQTYLAAAEAARRRDDHPAMTTPWLVGVARHKLLDHWRRESREQRRLFALNNESREVEDIWDIHLDALRARATLAAMAPHHRAALTLRYLDDLPVSEVAACLDRTVHGTEGLLSRARAAFRRTYEAEGGSDA